MFNILHKSIIVFIVHLYMSLTKSLERIRYYQHKNGRTNAFDLIKNEMEWIIKEVRIIAAERKTTYIMTHKSLICLDIPIGATLRVLYVDPMSNNRIGVRVKIDYAGDLSKRHCSPSRTKREVSASR